MLVCWLRDRFAWSAVNSCVMNSFIHLLYMILINEDYALLGKIMSLIYLLGAIGICLMPKGVGGEIKD